MSEKTKENISFNFMNLTEKFIKISHLQRSVANEEKMYSGGKTFELSENIFLAHLSCDTIFRQAISDSDNINTKISVPVFWRSI